MTELGYIVVFGIGMGLIALSGSLTLLVGHDMLRRILLPLVAFAAGSLIGGALFHMIPGAVQHMGNGVSVYLWITAGFLLFLALEQFLKYQSRRMEQHNLADAVDSKEPAMGITRVLLDEHRIIEQVHSYIEIADALAEHLGVLRGATTTPAERTTDPENS